MKLKTFIDMVIATAEIETEDLSTSEHNRLRQKIMMYANIGMDAIARETFPLERSTTKQGPQDMTLPGDWIKILHCRGGKTERYVDEQGKEHLILAEKKDYRITYTELPRFIESLEEDYTFEFPLQVINALIYYCAYHILSTANDKREYAYFLTMYNQQCANIVENLPKRARIEGGVSFGI